MHPRELAVAAQGSQNDFCCDARHQAQRGDFVGISRATSKRCQFGTLFFRKVSVYRNNPRLRPFFCLRAMSLSTVTVELRLDGRFVVRVGQKD